MKNGYDLELTGRYPSVWESRSSLPEAQDGWNTFYDAFTIGKADAVLAASLFHFGEIAIPELKKYLEGKGIPVRHLPEF